MRARIADFARAHRVDIDVEIAGGEVAAIRFAVTFGGCCGYEGADVLALRLGRPRTSECCGCEHGWLDDWSHVSEDGSVHMRVRVRVNRVSVRWEPTVSIGELIDRANDLVGADALRIAETARDRWLTVEPGRRYLLEEPYRFSRALDFGWPPPLAERGDLGFVLVVDRGRISEVDIALHDDTDVAAIRTALRKHARRDRIVAADLDDYSSRIVITRR